MANRLFSGGIILDLMIRLIPRFLTRFLQIPTAVDVIPNRVGPLGYSAFVILYTVVVQLIRKLAMFCGQVPD